MKIDNNELTIYEVEAFHKELLEEFGNENVILDFSNVQKIDMSVIQLLISAQKSSAEASKKFELTNVSDEVQAILKSAACEFLLGSK